MYSFMSWGLSLTYGMIGPSLVPGINMPDEYEEALKQKYKDTPFDRFFAQWQYDAISSAGVVHSSINMLLNMIENNEDLNPEELKVILDIALQSNENTIKKIRFAAKHVEQQSLAKDS